MSPTLLPWAQTLTANRQNMSEISIRAAHPADRRDVLALLTASGLPDDGVDGDLAGFAIAETEGRIVGCAGLEQHGRDGLLRSVAVAESQRGRGIGMRLTGRVIEYAQSRGLEGLYALTTTAETYFPRLGFERIERSRVPEAIQASEEFRTVCPTTAAVLRLILPSPV